MSERDGPDLVPLSKIWVFFLLAPANVGKPPQSANTESMEILNKLPDQKLAMASPLKVNYFLTWILKL